MALRGVLGRRRGRPSPDTMTVAEHLAELRSRLIKSVLAILAGGVIGFALWNQLLDVLTQPYCDVLPADRPCRLLVTDPLEAFGARVTLAAYVGVVLAFPVVLWQLWRFITPGLNPGEKRYAVPFVVTAVVLFVLGAGLAYWSFPRALDFLVAMGGENIETFFSPGRYLRLIGYLMLVFGIGFQFPILLVFLQLAGVVSTDRLRRWRRVTVVVIVTVVAVATPSGDPITLLALSVPMYLFYEASIGVGRLLRARHTGQDEEVTV